MDVGGWLDECWYEKWALVCNFGILSLLESSCVYLFNIHLEPGTINSAAQNPFKNKKPVRRTKCEQLTEHSAFRLIWKYLLCPLACPLFSNKPLYFCLKQIYWSMAWDSCFSDKGWDNRCIFYTLMYKQINIDRYTLTILLLQNLLILIYNRKWICK